MKPGRCWQRLDRTGRAVAILLLSLLLAARAEDGTALSDRQVRDEAMTILLAGHETTANVLTWALYLLARHAAACEKLLGELSTVLVGSFLVMPRPLITLGPKGGMWMRIEEVVLPAAIKG